MFPIKNIRQYITQKLDADIGVLKKLRNVSLCISEGEREQSKGKEHGEHLDKITITDIPTNDVWIFDNEFNHRQHINDIINNGQKAAFTSSGAKVEMTILHHTNNRLYIFMIEMKRAISPSKYPDVVKKFETSLSTLSIFISAHFDFPTFEQSQIYPIGICCYNYYKDPQPNQDRDPKQTGGAFRKSYDEGKKELLQLIEPVILNRLKIPVILFENPNSPTTNSFEFSFTDITSRMSNLF